jgi:hypothetical protein
MRLRRAKPAPTGRQRLRASAEPERLDRQFSYRSRRSDIDLNTGRQLQREGVTPRVRPGLNYWLQRFGLVILLIAILISVFSALTLSTTPKILPLKGDKSGTFLRDLGEYQAAGQKILAGSFWNRNKITVDTNKISQQMVDQFPELASASLTVPLIAHRPIIYVEPATPVLIINGQGGAFVVADSGKALLQAPTPQALNHPELPVANDQSGLKLQLRRQALSTTSVQFIQAVLAQLKAKNIAVASMTLPAASSELDIQPAGQSYIVKFNLQSNKPRQEAGTYLSTLVYLQKQNITPSRYIDVRVDGRAYYQ